MMDTIDVAIPTSLYVHERVISARRLKSMWLNYSQQMGSHQKLHVSTAMKIALSWYLHLKVNVLSMTDEQVRKYLLFAVRKRPRDFTGKKSDVDDDTRVSDAVEGLIACHKYRRFM